MSKLPVAAALAALLVVQGAVAQTRITPPKNRYTPEDDVKLGREAAAEVRREYPVIRDEQVTAYLDRLGRRLVQAAPSDLNHPVFDYSFTPVNLKEINAFALPGGPMFVNRGMFDAASGEGEVVGVMAHELSHVLLRHGTANATRATSGKVQGASIAGAILGAVVGGGWGRVISQGSQFGVGTLLLKYSREYEKQADLLGAQIMARAGYDPRDLGRMFETIARQSQGSRGYEFLNSHPDPGNRSAYIAREAEALQMGPRPDTAGFQAIKSTFASLPPAKSMGDLAKRDTSGGGNGSNAPAAVGTLGRPVPPPAAGFQTARVEGVFQADIPTNWQGVTAKNAVKFVPQNAYGVSNGQSTFTHGVEFGILPAASSNLRDATTAFTNALAQANPDLRRIGEQQAARISQRTAIATWLANRSALGNEERIGLYTLFLADGRLFYYLTVVPAAEAGQYDPTFDRIGRSIRLADVR